MTPRYRWFLGVCTVVIILSWYYTIAFCGIFLTSSINWVYGSITGIFLDWFFLSTFIPVVRAFLRVIIRRYKRLNCLIFLEYAIWIAKNVCPCF